MDDKRKKELRDKIGRLVNESRVLVDEAAKESRHFTAEEEQTYQRIDAEIQETEDALREIDRMEKLEAREDWLNKPERDPIKPEVRVTPNDPEKPLAGREYRAAWAKYLRDGTQALNNYELRALSMGSDPGGGYTVPQEQFVTELIQRLDDMMPLRRIARGFQVVQAASLGAPALDVDPADADWTTELETGSEDTAMAFAKRELRPFPLAKLIKISNKLIRANAVGIEDTVQERMAYTMFAPLENAYMTGDGNSKPMGLFTAATAGNGITTGRDVDIGDGSGAYDPDDWITARYSLRQPYWANARWLFHRNVLAALRKLKDSSTGVYLWQPGLANGVPAMFLDLPYEISEFAPGTVATGNYQAVLGDFRFYWYADALGFTIQRLVELYAETNQTGFITRGEFDGMPVMEDAFIRCSFAA